MKRNAIVPILFAAGALIAVLFLFDRGDGLPGASFSEAEPAYSAGAQVPTQALPVAESHATRPIAAVRYVEVEERVAPDDDDALRVLVVEETTGMPVAGAEVVWIDETVVPTQIIGPYSGVSPLLADFDHARHRTVTDTHGLALVRASPRLAIAARRGDLFGLRAFKTAPVGEIRLVVGPGPLIAARVVGASGEPMMGVPVTLTISRKRGGSSSATWRTAVSRSPDGLAIADHAAIRRHAFEGEVEISARIDHPVADVSAKVPLEKMREGPITLVLPPTGRVVVKLVDALGSSIASASSVYLLASGRVSGKPARSTFMSARAESGIATFRAVPIGVPLSVSAYDTEYDSLIDQSIGTLNSAGEEIATELRFERRKAILTGRAIEESGAPLASRDLRVDVVTLGQVRAYDAPDRTRTDDTGTFRLVIDRKLFAKEGCEIEFEMDANRDRIERSGAVFVPRISDAEETSIGDVRLSAPALMASGVVVDENGEPLDDALVTIEGGRWIGTGEWTMGGRGPNRPPSFGRFRERTDAQGAFEVYGPPTVRWRVLGFSVQAEASGYVRFEAPATLEPGCKDVKIILHGAGAVEGRLLLPDPAAVRHLEIRVARKDPGAGSTTDYRFEDCVDSDGRFRVTGVLPGTATVVVRTSRSDETLATIPEVQVPRLGVADDPRLRAIDLRTHPALRR